jgi:hypothetical protein
VVVSGTAAAYSPEYRALATDGAQLLAIAERSGGQAWPALGPALHKQMLPRLFRPAKPARSIPVEIWPYLALAGVLLLPVDIGLRRLLLDRRELVAAAAAVPLVAWVAERRQRASAARPADPALARLREARRRAGVEGNQAVLTPPTVTMSAEAAPAPTEVTKTPMSEPTTQQEATGRLLDAKRRASRSRDLVE